jgi:Cof subfamily protein (haloacid dehalogenase superfamily)
VKLVASDLDGTLLGADSTVSVRTEAALKAVAAAGVEVVVATGRSHWTAVPLLDHIGCLRWVICSNGATVYDFEVGDVVLRRPLPDDVIRRVVDRIQDAFPSVGLAWESGTGIAQTEQWVANRAATNPAYATGWPEPTSELEIGASPILKLLVAHHELITYDWLNALQPYLPAGISASTSGASFVEITSSEANKGEALRQLCHQLRIDRADTIAFGDHSNDVGMLGWVGTGYAMANADHQVLAMADEVAPHHTEDGVAQILEVLVAAR